MSRGGYTLITGGAGFIGCNLADALLRDGKDVIIADNFSRDTARGNARWLERRFGSRVRILELDVRDRGRIAPLVREADTVCHLAAQVAVTTSLQDPRSDLETNLLGTFNILEAARAASEPPSVLYTSTNKVYGALEHLPIEWSYDGYRFADGRDGIDETTPLDFHSPYSCSKGAADQYIHDFARVYGLPTVVLRMSCVYGPHQGGSEDQGWVAHFARTVLAGRPLTIYGDGYQVRDLLWVEDLIHAIRAAADRAPSIAGAILNIGGGQANAVSVRTVVDRLIELTGCHVPRRLAPWRLGDQRVYISNIVRAQQQLDWRPQTRWRGGLSRLIDWLRCADGLAVSGVRERVPVQSIPLRAGA